MILEPIINARPKKSHAPAACVLLPSSLCGRLVQWCRVRRRSVRRLLLLVAGQFLFKNSLAFSAASGAEITLANSWIDFLKFLHVHIAARIKPVSGGYI